MRQNLPNQDKTHKIVGGYKAKVGGMNFYIFVNHFKISILKLYIIIDWGWMVGLNWNNQQNRYMMGLLIIIIIAKIFFFIS